jgi:hypothetical protein
MILLQIIIKIGITINSVLLLYVNFCSKENMGYRSKENMGYCSKENMGYRSKENMGYCSHCSKET